MSCLPFSDEPTDGTETLWKAFSSADPQAALIVATNGAPCHVSRSFFIDQRRDASEPYHASSHRRREFHESAIRLLGWNIVQSE
jgi:hypothetical protein